MSWITTSAVAGPLATNSYTWTITGLTAGSTYIYRSYFIVTGTTYYGNILTGTTAPPQINPPSVTSGIACNITNTYCVCNNQLTNKGGVLPIQEYGVLFTEYANHNTCSTLIYENVGNNVIKESCCCDITVNFCYSCGSPESLADNTTWYRAFVKNAAGIGYGAIYVVAPE